jgi:membrane associated rhomboid family serine protease
MTMKNIARSKEIDMPYLTYAVIGLTVFITFLGFNDYEFFEHNIFSVGDILKRGHIHRIISSQFFHADWGHLLVNMFSFYAFADSIELGYGMAALAIIYFGSGIGGDIITLLIKVREPHYRAVGASGAVSGIIFASIFLIPGGSIMVFPLPIPIRPWLYALLFIGASMYGIGKNNDYIGHEAHLGGALTGIALALLLFPAEVLSQKLLLAGVTIPVVLFFVLIIVKPDILRPWSGRRWR